MLKEELDEGSGEFAANLEAGIFLFFAWIQEFTDYCVGSQISVFVAFPVRCVMVMLYYFLFFSS